MGIAVHFSITCALVMGRVLLLVLVLNADVRGNL